MILYINIIFIKIFEIILFTLKIISDFICKSSKLVLGTPTIVGPKTIARQL